MTLIERQDKQ